MSLEIAKGVGITAAGIGLAVTLGVLIGIGVNGHVFHQMGSFGQYFGPALVGTFLVRGFSIGVNGAIKTKWA